MFAMSQRMLDVASTDISAWLEEIGERKERESERGKRLCCRSCLAVITDEGRRIEVDGAHLHHRSNPLDISFCFACFSAAPGCLPIGPATVEHSWFTGYHWQLDICRGCGEHLGWCFTGTDCFHGLIEGKLIAAGEEGAH